MEHRTELVRYDAMCIAIDACHQVDEAKDIRERAKALEAYARQAQNLDAERKAGEIRIRAERRCGELLREVEREPRKRTDLDSNVESSQTPYQRTLEQAKISERAAHQYQALANVPREEFEARLRDPVLRPSTSGIIAGHKASLVPPSRRTPTEVLDLWGWFLEFERRRFLDMDWTEMLDRMTDSMRDDLRRIAPQVIDWVTELEKGNSK